MTTSTPQLREYQTAAVSACMAARSGLAVLPTGSGKSLVIAGIVRKLDRVIVLQPSQEILASNLEKINAFGVDDVEVYSAGAGSKRLGRVTYATIQSIIKVKDQLGDVDALIVDEAHYFNSQGGQYLEFLQAVKPKRLIGLTATPYRLHTIGNIHGFQAKTRDGRSYPTEQISDLRLLTRTRPRAFDKLVHVTQCAELLEHGFLHQPEYIVSGQDEGLLRANSSGAEYSDQSVQKYMQKTNIQERIVAAVHDAIESGLRHILVFVPLLRESDRLVRELGRLGVAAANISGTTATRERAELLRQFKRGQIRVMVNVGVLLVGWDFPRLDCVVCARPTMSLALWYQLVGRSVRPHPEKERVAVYDLVNNAGRFGDPLHMKLVAGRTGLHYMLSANGRLTNRDMALGPEKLEHLGFGKHKQTPMCEVPLDYMQWYMENGEDSLVKHRMDAEMLRRQMFEVKA